MPGNVFECMRDIYNAADLKTKTTSIFTPQTSGVDAAYYTTRGAAAHHSSTDLTAGTVSARRGLPSNSSYAGDGFRAAIVVK